MVKQQKYNEDNDTINDDENEAMSSPTILSQYSRELCAEARDDPLHVPPASPSFAASVPVPLQWRGPPCSAGQHPVAAVSDLLMDLPQPCIDLPALVRVEAVLGVRRQDALHCAGEVTEDPDGLKGCVAGSPA